MERVTIANAVRGLETLLHLLDSAYWETSQISYKDSIYDMISTLHIESNELAKLSVEDHYMAYEPITGDFRNAQHKLKLLQGELHQWVIRARTAKLLEEALPQVISLLNPQH